MKTKIEKKIEELDKIISQVAAENFELSQKINNMDDQMEELWKIIQNLQKKK